VTTKSYVAALFVGVMVGCSYFVSWDHANKGAIGHSIDEIIKVEGYPNQTWTRDDGMTIYKYDLWRLDPSCVQYWIVDAGKLIVGSYHEGHCRPIG
jgi:hypothetical protein